MTTKTKPPHTCYMGRFSGESKYCLACQASSSEVKHETGCDLSLHLNDGGPDPCRNAEGWRLPRKASAPEGGA